MMRQLSTITGFLRAAQARVKRHQSLVVLLVMFMMFALVSSALFADTSPGTEEDVERITDYNRSCTVSGTPFENMWDIDDLVRKFTRDISAVVDERIRLLSTPSAWTCSTNAEDPGRPPMPLLQEMSASLPGWSVEYRIAGLIPVREKKPVTFENFASILMEYNREYQCQLSLIAANSLSSAATAGDIPSVAVQQDIVSIAAPYAIRANRERARGSAAIVRLLHVLRSYDVQYAYARDLMCYARASLDLRSELSLLADGVSCMPKIWDSATSLHDPVPPQKP